MSEGERGERVREREREEREEKEGKCNVRLLAMRGSCGS